MIFFFFQLQTSQSVFTWPEDIHRHIFELLVLFVDLVRLRLEQRPVPSVLLETLATVRRRNELFEVSFFSFAQVFDPNTTFSQKHKTDALPNGRTFLGDEENLLRRSVDPTKDSFPWIRFLIERVRFLSFFERKTSTFLLVLQFVNSNGFKTFLQQFELIDQTDANVATKVTTSTAFPLFPTPVVSL